MTDGALVAAQALLSALTAASGAAMVITRAAVPAGTALAGAGATGLAGAWLWWSEASDTTAQAVTVVAGAVLAPLSVYLYPVVPRRIPDWVMAAVGLSSGLAVVAFLGTSFPIGVPATLAVLAPAVSLWWRLETSSKDDRRPLLWVSLAGMCASLLAFTFVFGSDPLDTSLGVAIAVGVLGAVPVAMAVGVVVPEIVDVRSLVVHAVVWLVVGMGYVGLVAGLVSVAETITETPPTPGVVAVLGLVGGVGLRPATVLMRGVIDQLLFAERPDPLQAASSALDRMGADTAAGVAAIREALAVPYVSLVLDGEVITSGVEVTQARTVALPAVGAEMVVGLRVGELSLSAADEQVLRLAGGLVAHAVRAQRASAELSESRAAVIRAVEEERRRLRRDLHDGLGPTLSGIAFAADAARNSLPDADAVDRLLADLRADATSAVATVRELVYGMRPPALDELGLVRALHQQAAGLRGTEGRPLQVVVSAPEVLPQLPAAVEVAAYRIVAEALTNVARHSAATGATVTLGVVDDALLVAVADHGGAGGPQDAWRPGVGLTSMRERAAEVGGTLASGPTIDGGLVQVSLPLAAPAR